MKLVVIAVTASLSAAPPVGTPPRALPDPERILRKEIVIEAPRAEVWNAWTTEDGVRFVSAKSRIELRVGGAYEWFLDGPVEEDGRRGAEGSRVLAFLPQEMLAFEWTFPPAVMELRKADARTQVVILFEELDGHRTRVRLHALGWESGPAWDHAYNYFDRAWSMVLDLLKERLHAGRQRPVAPVVAEGVWEVRTTIRRGGQVVRNETSTREVRASVLDGKAAWLIVESATPPNVGVDSVWVRASDLKLLASRGANSAGESWSRLDEGGVRISGHMRHGDGSEMDVDLVAAEAPFHGAAIPLVLAAFGGEVGDVRRISVLDLHGRRIDPVESVVEGRSPEGMAQFAVKLPQITLHMTVEPGSRSPRSTTA